MASSCNKLTKIAKHVQIASDLKIFLIWCLSISKDLLSHFPRSLHLLMPQSNPRLLVPLCLMESTVLFLSCFLLAFLGVSLYPLKVRRRLGKYCKGHGEGRSSQNQMLIEIKKSANHIFLSPLGHFLSCKELILLCRCKHLVDKANLNFVPFL